MLIALGLEFATKSVAFIKRHLRAVNIAGGVFLMLIGVLMMAGLWTAWMSELQVWISGSVTPL